jgi:chromosome segregation ATPase
LTNENKHLTERIDSLLKDKSKTEEDNAHFLKEISALNKKVVKRESKIEELMSSVRDLEFKHSELNSMLTSRD